MVNRREKQLEEFKDFINKDWQLSLNENEFLDSVLNVLLLHETKKAVEIIDFFYSEEWDNLLDLIPERQIRYYVERSLNMIDEDECDCEDQKTLEDFDDDEIKEEYFDRFEEYRKGDIVTDLNVEEMNNLFLSLTPQKQFQAIELLKTL